MAGIDRGEDGPERGHADHRADDEVRVGDRGEVADGLRAAGDAGAAREGVGGAPRGRLVRERDARDAELGGLLRDAVGVAAGGEADDAEAPGEVRDDAQDVLADRARAAEQDDSLLRFHG